MIKQTDAWVASDAIGRMLVPSDNSLAQLWMQPGFDDSSWMQAVNGWVTIGFQQVRPIRRNRRGGWRFDCARRSNSRDFSKLSAGEGVTNAIDNNTSTKYLNFDKLNAGFTVTPANGPVVVTGLRLTSANDAPERDPTSFVLSGSNDGQTSRRWHVDLSCVFWTVRHSPGQFREFSGVLGVSTLISDR